MTDDPNLVEALKNAGHGDLAERLRDNTLARSLRDAGHDDVAEALERKLGGGQPTGEPAVPRTPEQIAAQQQAEGEAFVQELRDRLQGNTVTLPADWLLGE
jgi:hypothetical protein